MKTSAIFICNRKRELGREMATEQETKNCEHSISFPKQAYFHSLLSVTHGDSFIVDR